MEIFVLVKQVPATEAMVNIASDGKNVDAGDAKKVMNPYDEFAVEEALQMKKAHGGTVTILSAGPDKSVETIRTGLAMGADKGILVNDPATAECDGLGIAKILAAVIKQNPFDVILAGQRAVDDDNYFVGPAVAEFLDIPHISLVVEEEISNNEITCRRTVEGGTVVLKSSLPVLLTTQRGLNEPRYASLPGIMKAKKKKIETKNLEDIGLSVDDIKPMMEIKKVEFPPERAAGRIIEGESAREKVVELVRALKEEAGVI